jgi:hypothetical protein
MQILITRDDMGMEAKGSGDKAEFSSQRLKIKHYWGKVI